MPAFASFSKTYVAKSKYFTAFRDRFASYLAASKTKLVSKSKPFPRLRLKRPYLRDDRADILSHSHMGQYSELNGGANASRSILPGFLTKIHTAPHGHLQEGIIMESLTVEQSTHEKHVANQL